MSAPVAEGDVVLEKYRVERVLGQGGMGVVVAATHVDLDQRVALKFLLPEALAHPELVERFAREARAAAKIESRHVVRVLDTGRMPSGAPFMVMEYLDGRDLADVLEHETRLVPEVAIDYVLQACEAIAEAHAAGIVHRDLKPANLFLATQRDRRTIVKVLDFGISKVEDPKAAPLTRTATMMGSPLYMSPEQLTSSKDVDARTDIWSLGVILYELMAGVRPFEAETMPEIVGQILKNQPPRLATIRPDVPPALDAVVSRCLASAPSDRFASVAELAAALQPFADEASAESVARIGRVLGAVSVPPSAVPVSTKRSPGDAPTARIGSSPDLITGGGANSSTFAQAQTAHAVALSTPEIATTARPPRQAWLLAVGGLVVLGGAAAAIGLRARSASVDDGVHGIVASATSDPAAPVPKEAPRAPEPTATATAEPAATVAEPAATAEPTATASAEPPPRRATKSGRPAAARPTEKPSPTAPPATAPTSTSKSPLQMGIK